MRRVLMLLTLGMVVLGLGTSAPGVSAQDSTPQSLSGHPLVGTWVLTEPEGTPSVLAFSSDGIVTDAEFDGGSGVGAWEATGEQTAALTLVIPIASPEFTATIQINATLEVDATGDAGTVEASFTVVMFDGTVVFAGDASATITRLPIQPLTAKGTPMAEIPTWQPEQEEGGDEPEATPSA